LTDINYNGYGNDPFALQEAFATGLNGKENDLFHKAEVTGIELDNLNETENDTEKIYSRQN
jgi:hypothetical protein